MRRGYYLEQQLDKVLAHLNAIGIHAHKNHVKRTEGGIYLEGEPFDYEVFAHGKLTCFDAKESHAKRWNLSNAKPMQVKHLLDCHDHGADAFFLVYFVPEHKLVRFDVSMVHKALCGGIKSFTSSEGVPWDWEELTRSNAR